LLPARNNTQNVVSSPAGVTPVELVAATSNIIRAQAWQYAHVATANIPSPHNAKKKKYGWACPLSRELRSNHHDCQSSGPKCDFPCQHARQHRRS
jgi:hypothetical protein